MPMDDKIEPEFACGDEDYYTIKEAIDAIRNLSGKDYIKLSLIARFFIRSRHISNIEPENLLHDAIAKTIDGRRRWKKGISIIKHLDRNMESDSGQ
jgi:hypothetical protein